MNGVKCFKQIWIEIEHKTYILSYKSSFFNLKKFHNLPCGIFLYLPFADLENRLQLKLSMSLVTLEKVIIIH